MCRCLLRNLLNGIIILWNLIDSSQAINQPVFRKNHSVYQCISFWLWDFEIVANSPEVLIKCQQHAGKRYKHSRKWPRPYEKLICSQFSKHRWKYFCWFDGLLLSQAFSSGTSHTTFNVSGFTRTITVNLVKFISCCFSYSAAFICDNSTIYLVDARREKCFNWALRH